MKKNIFLLCLTVFILGMVFQSVVVYGSSWKKIKGSHFVVQFEPQVSSVVAKEVLREAERYYRSIAQSLGYTRYKDFWTWDDRVNIFLFATPENFHKVTGQPAWSRGSASSQHFEKRKIRSIATYVQEDGFLDGLLPHEISHLMTDDFIGIVQVPLWFNEGVAQLQEAGKKEKANRLMSSLVGEGQFIPFSFLMTYDIRHEKNPYKVSLFYLQSLSIVDFMLRTYGGRSFNELCRNMKEGLGFKEALKKSYSNVNVRSIKDLEQRWFESMKRNRSTGIF